MLCDTVVPVSSPEVSELSKLLENAFLSVNIGLVNEITRLSLSLGVQSQEVCEAAATKPFGYLPFYPGPGVGGHCLPNDLWLLANSARSHGWNPELLDGAIAVNAHAPLLVVDRIEQLLREKGKELRGASILLVGVGFKPGSGDTTLSPAFTVVRELRERGAFPSFSDSRVPRFEVDGIPVPAITPAEITKGAFNAVTILSGDDRLKPDALTGVADVLLDASGRKKGFAVAQKLQTL
jgi:UDP-N-acetyl-D-glucosamine dehydrogenase